MKWLAFALSLLATPAFASPIPAIPVGGALCTASPGTLVWTLDPGTYTYTGDASFAVSGNSVVVGSSGILPADCGTTVFISVAPATSSAIALDGSGASGVQSGTNVCPVTLTTTNANDIIVVYALENQNSSNPLSGISSAHTTGWSSRAATWDGGVNFITEWRGKASAALSNEIIAVTGDGGSSVCSAHAFGISGADQTTIYDSNAALPSKSNTSTVSITTSNANDIIFAGYRFGSTPTPSQGAGWNKIQGNGYLLTEYKVVSTTQSAVAATIGTGNANENGGIGDAIISSTTASGTAQQIFADIGR